MAVPFMDGGKPEEELMSCVDMNAALETEIVV